MKNRREKTVFQQRLSQQLNHQAEQISTAIAERLQAARQQALKHYATPAKAELNKPKIKELKDLRLERWLIQGFAVVCCVVGVMSILWLSQVSKSISTPFTGATQVSQENRSELDMIDVLLSNEDMDFLENLDVYVLLAEQSS
ncbi:MAG: hypothetical protein CR991_08255 [Proteobacteria bacterium]|nr:MAG: hypothetical protein CR991_08255 [Pseudomonadota bacterium]